LGSFPLNGNDEEAVMGSGSSAIRPQEPIAGRMFQPGHPYGPAAAGGLAAVRWDSEGDERRSNGPEVAPGRGCGLLFLPAGTIPFLIGSAALLDDGGERISNDAVFVLVALIALATAVVTMVSLLTLLMVLVDDGRTERLVRLIRAFVDRRRRRGARNRSR
jgi:hypothetical protein